MNKLPATIGELLALGAAYLSQQGKEAARLDAELLLSHLLKKDRVKLLLENQQAIDTVITAQYLDILKRRSNAEPLAYLTGEKEFMSLRFKVSPAVLIPRPETEILAETLINIYKDQKKPLTGVDLGTGSGCIAISLSYYLPQLKIFATDISLAALRIAQENAQILGTAERITFFQSELFSEFSSYNIKPGSLDFIVSNPPYIPTQQLKNLMPEVLREPHQALDGGADGLDFYRKIILGAAFYLKEGGVLALELGENQAAAVKTIFRESNYYSLPIIYPDLAVIQRVITAEKKNG